MTATAIRSDDVVTFRVGRQWFGIGVLQVQEIIGLQKVTRVPLAGPDVAGLLNLRGQIVTAIDMHKKLEISPESAESLMNVVVREADELFALVVDEVGDVATVLPETLEALPAALDGTWGRVCTGVVRKEDGLLALLDVSHLLEATNTRQ